MNTASTPHRFRLLALLAVLPLAACQSIVDWISPPPIATPLSLEAQQALVSARLTQIAAVGSAAEHGSAIGGAGASVKAATPAAPENVLVAGQPAPTDSAPPIRFVFPDSGPEAVSAWRPPLYSVPWAPSQYDHFYFIRPIAADQVNWPLPDYRYGGVFFEDEVHTGVDIDAPNGTEVIAAGPGRVMWAGFGLYTQSFNLDDPYGLAVAVRHDFGYGGQALYTIYGHMQEIFVTRGQRLNTGDRIGLTGVTGHTTGPHLHFEVRIGNNDFYTSRNPELWMSPPQGWGILAARVMGSGGEPIHRLAVDVRNQDTGQTWQVITYGAGGATNADPYYKENMVIGDLPAGNYTVSILYESFDHKQDLVIRPGQVTYFRFRGKDGYEVGSPPAPSQSNFTPPTP